MAPLRYHFPHQIQEYPIAEDHFRNQKKAPKGMSEAYLRCEMIQNSCDENITLITPEAYSRRMWVKNYLKESLKPL